MGILFSNIKVKWTRYSAQKLFLSRCFNFVCGYLPYIKEWLIWKNNLKYIFFFICKSSKMTILFKKWIWLVVLLFALRFQVIFYIEVKYQFHKSSQNQFHLTELYCLSSISPSMEADFTSASYLALRITHT